MIKTYNQLVKLDNLPFGKKIPKRTGSKQAE